MVLQEYAKRIVSDVHVLEGMEHVPQPNDHTSACECQRSSHVTGDDVVSIVHRLVVLNLQRNVLIG